MYNIDRAKLRPFSIDLLFQILKGERPHNYEDLGVTYNDEVVTINHAYFEKNIETDHHEPLDITVRFQHCIFKTAISFRNHLISGLSFSNCIFEASLTIGVSTGFDNISVQWISVNACKLSSLNIFRCNVQKGFYVTRAIIENILGLHFSNVPYVELFWISDSGSFTIQETSIDTVSIRNSSIKNIGAGSSYYSNNENIIKSFNIVDGRFDSIRLAASINKLWLGPESFGTHKLIAKEIHISAQLIFECYIRKVIDLEKLRVYDRIVSGSTFSIEDVKTNKLIVEGLVNRGNLIFRNFSCLPVERRRSAFLIIDSVLNDTTFLNVDFDGFDNIIIYNSDVSDITTHGYHIKSIPNKSVSAFYDKQKPVIDFNNLDYSKLAGLYNQLSLAMQKQGNQRMSNEYHASFLECKRLYFKQRKVKWVVRSVLWLNKQTNDYGRNWLQSSALTMAVALVLFVLYVISLKQHLPVFDTDQIPFFLGKYFEFTLPIHKTDFMIAKPNGYAILIDSISRIFIGILIYQTITAFRKQGQ
ncbi:MAG: hypothetical protein AAFX87_04920 [Bacteroidota bacterium]